MEKTRLTNSGRVMEIELMKAIAIISMVLVHVLATSVLLDRNAPETFPVVWLIAFFGGFPSAGVFMFAMGWGNAFSARADAKSCLKRCFTLFAVGIFINLFTQYLRAVLCPREFGPLTDVFPYILATDIYFFAALANLYFAVMKKLESKNTLRIVISVLLVGICFCVNSLVPPESFTTGSNWADTILGLLIRVNDRSYFPFISWIVFPVIGFGAASFLKKYGMKKFMITAAVTGAVALAVSLVSGQVLDITSWGYYGLHPVKALEGYAIIVVEFFVATLILKASKNRLPGFMLTMSKNVSYIYIVQWVLASALAPVLVMITNVWINVVVGIAVLIASYFLGMLLKKTNLIRI